MNSVKTVTAHFQLTSHTLTLIVVPTEGGSVTKNPDKTEYTYGDQVALTATPNAGYKFDHWSGDLTGNVNPVTITMDDDKTVTAHFVKIPEVVSKPAKPAGSEKGYRAQLLTFSAYGSVSNLGHNVEYQFDWGDGNLSNWGTSPDQLFTNITRITSPNGKSGLPSAGKLMDYSSGRTTRVKLTVTGGDEYDGTTLANKGAEPDSATDAYDVFNSIVSCLGTISYQNEADSPLVMTLTGMSSDKRYNLVFYYNCDDYGWEEASLVTISGMEGFSNESSTGNDNSGNPLFSGPNDHSTKLPAKNTSTGYIAHFTNVDPGSDGGLWIMDWDNSDLKHSYQVSRFH